MTETELRIYLIERLGIMSMGELAHRLRVRPETLRTYVDRIAPDYDAHFEEQTRTLLSLRTDAGKLEPMTEEEWKAHENR